MHYVFPAQKAWHIEAFLKCNTNTDTNTNLLKAFLYLKPFVLNLEVNLFQIIQMLLPQDAYALSMIIDCLKSAYFLRTSPRISNTQLDIR